MAEERAGFEESGPGMAKVYPFSWIRSGVNRILDWNLLIQAVIALVIMSAPISPEKIILFNDIIRRDGLDRTQSATRVALVTFFVLAGATLVGRELLQLLGIDQDAFSVVGGLIIAGMGFDMLYQGQAGKAQSGGVDREAAEEKGGLIIPLSVPLIAGPGAIVTAITISSTQASLWTLLAGVAGAAIVGLLGFVSFEWLGGLMSRLSDTGTMLIARIGGMLLATLGVQMLLGGLKNFFG